MSEGVDGGGEWRVPQMALVVLVALALAPRVSSRPNYV